MSNRNKMFKWSNLMWYGRVAISLGKSELSTHARNSSRWPMRSLRASRALHCSVSIVLLCILLLLWGQCVSPLSFLLFLGSAPASLTIVLPIEYCTALTRVLVPGLTRGCCGNSKLYNLDHWTYLYNVDHHSMLFNVHNVDHWISHNIDNIYQGGWHSLLWEFKIVSCLPNLYNVPSFVAQCCPSNIVQHWPGWLVALLWELWSCATLTITVAKTKCGHFNVFTAKCTFDQCHSMVAWCRCWSSPRPSTSSACTVNNSPHVLHGTAEYYQYCRVLHYILCTIPHANDTLRCGLWASIAPNWIVNRTCQRANLFFPFQAISKCQSFKRSEGKIKNPNFSGSSTFLALFGA